MIKKILLVSLVVLTSLTLTACKADKYTVTFDAQGGTAVAAVVVEDGKVVALPTAPTHAAATDGTPYSFVAWYKDAEGTMPYDFDMAVTADMTIYAVWSLNKVLSFDTRTTGTIEPQLFTGSGGFATEPAAPTRAGYSFEGWFTSKRGLTWDEDEALEFPLSVSENTTIYAYWEPLNSKSVDYTDDQTYTSSLDASSFLVLNPLVYEWSHEDAFVDMMVTPMYESTIVDWDKAIEEGVAMFAGDFSKIIAKEYSIEALDYINILMGATQFPVDSEGEEHLTSEGLYDRDNASAIKDTEWTINIREDLVFENGDPITSADFEYSMKMYLSPSLNNSRANMFFKTDEEKNGTPILNGYEYYTGAATWDQVGFEIIDDYSFTITLFESLSQAGAVGFANNLRLVHEASFEASLDSGRTNSTYGTPVSPYVSYGEYLIKTWDENAKLVFNKNYDYILPGTINYKSRVIEIVANIDAKMLLFAAGDLSVASLNADYYEEYAEAENVYKSWDGYPQYLIINTAPSKVTEGGHVHSDIIYDVRFRQALLYGFDRKYFATSVYAPNTASLLPIPLDTKSYIQDALYYSESPQHLAVLETLNIDPATEGYIPELAISLFNAAYDAWDAVEGNSGPVPMKFTSVNDEFTRTLVDYIEASYEALFGTDKLDIQVAYASKDLDNAEKANWNFDLALTAVGFGSSSGAWWQYPFIATLPALMGGASFGLYMPYDASTTDGWADYYHTDVTIDFKATFAYLEELGVDHMTNEELEGHLLLHALLVETLDTDGVTVLKEAGMYVGNIIDIADIFLSYDVPLDGAASEPFPGATSDSWNLIAAFEKIFFDYAPLVPTVTRSSAVIYAANVVIEWPAYSGAFGWGPAQYRYLNTDPDFQ